MRKFEINKVPKSSEPTKEQIARHKDFGRLRGDYETLTKRGKRPIYQDPKLWMLMFIIGLVIFLMFYEGK